MDIGSLRGDYGVVCANIAISMKGSVWGELSTLHTHVWKKHTFPHSHTHHLTTLRVRSYLAVHAGSFANDDIISSSVCASLPSLFASWIELNTCTTCTTPKYFGCCTVVYLSRITPTIADLPFPMSSVCCYWALSAIQLDLIWTHFKLLSSAAV